MIDNSTFLLLLVLIVGVVVATALVIETRVGMSRNKRMSRVADASTSHLRPIK